LKSQAYDSKQYRQWLRRQGIKPTIPPNKRRPRRGPKRGSPIVAGPGYRERGKVERTLACCGHFRRLLVRHERYLTTFRAFLLIAFSIIFLRHS
jgi:transposase